MALLHSQMGNPTQRASDLVRLAIGNLSIQLVAEVN